MKATKRALIGLVLSVGMILGMGQMAHATCYYNPPTGSDAGHVHYYNCQGPYWGSNYPPYYRYYCYADWDWYAEWFWGKHDGPVWVWGVESCYA